MHFYVPFKSEINLSLHPQFKLTIAHQNQLAPVKGECQDARSETAQDFMSLVLSPHLSISSHFSFAAVFIYK